MAPARGTTRAPTLGLSKLNRLALKLAVYASQGGSPHHYARLASRCWLRSPGRAWLPAGSHRKVSRCFLHLSPLSQAYLAQSPFLSCTMLPFQLFVDCHSLIAHSGTSTSISASTIASISA